MLVETVESGNSGTVLQHTGSLPRQTFSYLQTKKDLFFFAWRVKKSYQMWVPDADFRDVPGLYY